MNRNLVCLLRLFIDCLPASIRNSKILFKLSQAAFNLPESLFTFRSDYSRGLYPDLSILYKSDSELVLAPVSPLSDINSFHFNYLRRLVCSSRPESVLDIGSGSGHLLSTILKLQPTTYVCGIDYQKPADPNIQFIEGDILSCLQSIPANSYDLVTCTHVLEHVSDPIAIIKHIRRISRQSFVLISPLEQPFAWGYNLHINFFPKASDFLALVTSSSIDSAHWTETYTILGDCLVHQMLASKS